MPVWMPVLHLTADRLPWAGRWPRQATDEALAEAREIVVPQAVYEFVDVEPTPAGPRLADGTTLHCPALGPAGRLVLAVCTIGPALEARCQEWTARGDLTRAFLLDALGVVALQELGNQLERRLTHQLAPLGLIAGCPCSPGQDDWPLTDQRVLFTVLQPERIGVRLTESCLMVPLKSASSAFPVGRKGDLPPGEPACARCERWQNCPYAFRETETSRRNE